MSQKKVDAYKESKKTRKQDAQKEKRSKLIGRIVGWCLVVIAVAGLAVGLFFTFRNMETTSDDDAYVATNQVISDLADMEEKNTTEAPEESAENGEATTAAAGD